MKVMIMMVRNDDEEIVMEMEIKFNYDSRV